MPSPFDQLDTPFRGRKHGLQWPVSTKSDALVRQRPGISLDELRKALGPDISRPLKRLEYRIHQAGQLTINQYRVR